MGKALRLLRVLFGFRLVASCEVDLTQQQMIERLAGLETGLLAESQCVQSIAKRLIEIVPKRGVPRQVAGG